MKTYFDCIPCFLRQALNVSRLVSDDPELHERVLRSLLCETAKMDLRMTPPQMGQKMHRLIREYSGQEDPYRELKDWANSFAMEMLPELRERIERSGDPLETAVRLAIAGNIIDFAVLDPVSGVKVIEETISRALDVPLEGHMENFREAVGSAERILYLTDNAGEIAFDRLLAEQIGTSGMTIAVRGAPVINDATIDDARACGLSDIFDVVDNGADVPGTLLDLCSNEFRETFSTADMIIAKGMGNYESLSDVDSNIYFLLKVKCRVIANDIGFDEGSMVVFNSG